MPFYQLPSGASPVLAGTAPPTGGIGQNGDLFIDTANKTLYGPKAAGAWPTGIDLSFGPAGTTGPTGPTGMGVTGGIAFSVGPTAPTAPDLTVAGAVWLDQTSGRYFVRYQTQFIEIGVQGERGPTGVTGPQSTVTGPTGPNARGGANRQTIATGITLTESSDRYQFLTCTGGSQTVVLPTGMSAGLDFVIQEVTSFSGINLEAPGAVYLTTIYSTAQLVVWDGSTWRIISLY